MILRKSRNPPYGLTESGTRKTRRTWPLTRLRDMKERGVLWGSLERSRQIDIARLSAPQRWDF